MAVTETVYSSLLSWLKLHLGVIRLTRLRVDAERVSITAQRVFQRIIRAIAVPSRDRLAHRIVHSQRSQARTSSSSRCRTAALCLGSVGYCTEDSDFSAVLSNLVSAAV